MHQKLRKMQKCVTSLKLHELLDEAPLRSLLLEPALIPIVGDGRLTHTDKRKREGERETRRR